MMNNPGSKRFVLLGTARSGSNLLQTLLNSNEHITMYGELFNLDILSPENLASALGDPIAYLKKWLYPTGDQGDKTIGFKLFYDHMTPDYFHKMIAPDDTSPALKKKFADLDDYIAAHFTQQEMSAKFRQVWDYLVNDTSLKVIHLKRDMLGSLVSLKVAFITDQWMRWDPGKTEKTTCNLGYEECRNYFTRLSKYEQATDSLFRHHPKIEISYEEMVSDRASLVNRVLGFLDLPPGPVSTSLKQQSGHPPEEVIGNYRELKEKFSGSPWHRLFV